MQMSIFSALDDKTFRADFAQRVGCRRATDGDNAKLEHAGVWAKVGRRVTGPSFIYISAANASGRRIAPFSELKPSKH